MTTGWLFEKLGDMGGSHHGVYLNSLNAAKFGTEVLLAREAIQNSVDAWDGDSQVVKMRFTQNTLRSGALSALANLLGLIDDGSPTDRSNRGVDLGLEGGNFLDAVLDPQNSAQNTLKIEDFGTFGLGGPLSGSSDRDARFYRLLKGYGVEDHSATSTGGTYGFGKRAYSRPSNANTVAYYSVFHPTTDTGQIHARLIVASLFHTHLVNGIEYGGRAWYGELVSPTVCDPLVDTDAHEFAERLGFDRRSRGDRGTSIMAFGSSIDMSELRRGIEENWWPRMVDGTLECELREDEELLESLNPRARADLRPFIRGYEIAKTGVPDQDANEIHRRYNRTEGLSIGSCGAVAVEAADFDEGAREGNLDHDHRPRPNTVALVRSPRMVVKYSRLSNGADVAATFVASDEFDPVLKLAEPDTHDEWSANGDHLRNHPHRLKVMRLHENIRSVIRQLRDRLVIHDSPHDERPRELERALGRLLRSIGAGGPTNPRSVGPFNIDISPRRQRSHGRDVISGSVGISLRPSAPADEINCRLAVEAWLIGNDNRSRVERVGIKLRRVNHRQAVVSDDRSSARFPTARERVVTCTYEVDPVEEYCLVDIEAKAEQID